jgi:23S rRNA (adenine2030-N6)-methyltransferase
LEAFKTGEWRDGIGRLLQSELQPDVAALLSPFLDEVRRLNPNGSLMHYPGSPELARQLLRTMDRLLLNELHPQDQETLAARYAGNKQVRLSAVDAGQAVRATLPFHEKRGVVLLDPPFESKDESEVVARMVRDALRRMAHACVLVWYPVTTRTFADQFCLGINLEGAKSAMRAELLVRAPRADTGLAGSGLIVINPPWTLFDECKKILPALAEILGESGQGGSKLEWIVQPK